MKYWVIEDLKNGYANIYCPTIHEDQVSSFSIKRQIYKELFRVESVLKESGFIGWVAWTGLCNPHIMKFFRKIGARPYEIAIKEEAIWFKREI